VSIPPGPSATSLEETYPTCYVEEEVPPEPPVEAVLQAHNQQAHAHHEAAKPIPSVSIESHRQEQSLFADSGCLTLIFELRSFWMIRSFTSHELTRDLTCSLRLTQELFQRDNARRVRRLMRFQQGGNNTRTRTSAQAQRLNDALD
jgi:hypothetical protein